MLRAQIHRRGSSVPMHNKSLAQIAPPRDITNEEARKAAQATTANPPPHQHQPESPDFRLVRHRAPNKARQSSGSADNVIPAQQPQGVTTLPPFPPTPERDTGSPERATDQRTATMPAPTLRGTKHPSLDSATFAVNGILGHD